MNTFIGAVRSVVWTVIRAVKIIVSQVLEPVLRV
jgi:hypothetical protein